MYRFFFSFSQQYKVAIKIVILVVIEENYSCPLLVQAEFPSHFKYIYLLHITLCNIFNVHVQYYILIFHISTQKHKNVTSGRKNNVLLIFYVYARTRCSSLLCLLVSELLQVRKQTYIMIGGHFIVHSIPPSSAVCFSSVFFHSKYYTESEKEKQLISRRIREKQYLCVVSILLQEVH